MPSLTVVLPDTSTAELPREAGGSVVLQKSGPAEADFFSGLGILRLFEEARTDYLVFVLPGEHIVFPEIRRLIEAAEESEAGLVYSDLADESANGRTDHPLIDYQIGSVRDDFDFGAAFLISTRAALSAFREYGSPDPDLRWAGLYDLRLKLSIDSRILRLLEPLYTRKLIEELSSGERQFDYVDPKQRDYQIEMERVATAHLKRIGAFLPPVFRTLRPSAEGFPVRASVVMPVRNRERTVADAVKSALSQQASFDFNVIAVDNHSTDRTTGIISELARRDPRLVHLIPERRDLGIGGCWNEAIFSAHCGAIAIQLDSDDLYSDQHTIARIVSRFAEGPYAMVIGSYTIVNFEMQEIPPGLIDHREWTRENGRNNALRINGLGAPRAFSVQVLRETRFPNTSYGEDYAAGLRISRLYEIGRIYDSIYFARRWEGNSDASLDRSVANRYALYKDRLRTLEILARQKLNSEG